MLRFIQTQWCAPACAECVLKYNNINIQYKNNKDQCAIMEYIRETFNTHGGINGLGCCSPDPPGFSHTCDEGVKLGFNNEEVSIKNILKHFGNGTLLAYTTTDWLRSDDIKVQLGRSGQGQPLIAQWDYWDVFMGAHAVVICGIKREGIVDLIHYMDPGEGIKIWEPTDSSFQMQISVGQVVLLQISIVHREMNFVLVIA